MGGPCLCVPGVCVHMCAGHVCMCMCARLCVQGTEESIWKHRLTSFRKHRQGAMTGSKA